MKEEVFMNIKKNYTSVLLLLLMLIPGLLLSISPDEFYRKIEVEDPVIYENLAIYPVV
jgi:hypothetical protein